MANKHMPDSRPSQRSGIRNGSLRNATDQPNAAATEDPQNPASPNEALALCEDWVQLYARRIYAQHAKTIAGTWSAEDLAQEGRRGVLEAYRRFDPLLGNKFLTYALHWLNGFMRRAVKEKGSLIQPSSHQMRQVREVWGRQKSSHGERLSIESGLPSSA